MAVMWHHFLLQCVLVHMYICMYVLCMCSVWLYIGSLWRLSNCSRCTANVCIHWLMYTLSGWHCVCVCSGMCVYRVCGVLALQASFVTEIKPTPVEIKPHPHLSSSVPHTHTHSHTHSLSTSHTHTHTHTYIIHTYTHAHQHSHTHSPPLSLSLQTCTQEKKTEGFVFKPSLQDISLKRSAIFVYYYHADFYYHKP